MRPLALAALLLAAGALAACADRADDPAPADAPETEAATAYTVRGVFVGPLYDGEGAMVQHEAIPGLMDAMTMPFRVADPAALAGLAPGDKIQFRLVQAGSAGFQMADVERLPAETALDLPAGPPQGLPTDTTAADTTAAP